MAIDPRVRKRIAMLIVAVGSALIVERVAGLSVSEPEVAAPVRPRRAVANETAAPPAPADAASSAQGVRLDRLDALRRDTADVPKAPASGTAAPFGVVSWMPPPPKVVEPPPPKPQAPAFPYAYIGGLSEDGQRTSFFARGDRVLPVKAGDTVDSVYRVDQMTDKQMTLTYLPLNETLTVALGGGR